MAAYRTAKLEIFARQAAADVAVAPVGPRDPRRRGPAGPLRDGPRADLAERTGSLWWGSTELLGVDEIRLRGPHNRLNAMAAAAVTLARGSQSRPSVPACEASRASRIDSRRSRLWAACCMSTTPRRRTSPARWSHSTSFPPASVHLILGGQGKGQSFESLRDAASERCVGVYLIGEDAPALSEALAPLQALRSGDLEHAVKQARAAARPGQVILLSPACASFDQFADFEHRGDRFRELVGAVAR